MHRHSERLCRFLLALGVILHAFEGQASGPLRIAVIRDARAAPASITRLHGELATLGLEVVEVEVENAADPDLALDVLARSVRAVAAARIVSDLGIEVWISDHANGRTLLRKFVVGPGKTVDEIVALRASELVRATLGRLELSQSSRPAVETPEPRAERRPGWLWSAQTGAAVLVSSGGVGPTAELALGSRLYATPAVSFGAIALLPMFASTLREREGDAQVRPFVFGADAQYRVWAGAAWGVRAGAGISGVYMAVSGKANAAYADRDDALVVAAPYLRLSLTAELHRNLLLSTDALLGLAIPQPNIEFGQRTVARWGRPLSSAGLVLELRLW